MKIDWKRKLASRKFWVALVGFISPILIAFNVPESDVATITSIIMSGATLIAYILAEGFVDAQNVEVRHFYEVYEEEEEEEGKERKPNPIGFKTGGDLND